MEQNRFKKPIFYTIYVRGYDNLSYLHGKLHQVRRSFFETGNVQKKHGSEIEDGETVVYHYIMADKKLKWQKKTGHTFLQKAFPEKDGYYIVTWNREGKIVSKTQYSKDHLWLRTSYYGQNAKESERPRLVISLNADGQNLNFIEYDEDSRKYVEGRLYACSTTFGTVENSLMDSVAGEARIYAATSQGDFCFCKKEELEVRNNIKRKLEEGSISTKPEWDVKPKTVTESSIKDMEANINSTAVEGADTTNIREKEPLAQMKEEMDKISFGNQTKEKEEFKAKSIPVLQEDNQKSYHANHELFQVEVCPKSDFPQKYTVAAKNREGVVFRSERLTEKESSKNVAENKKNDYEECQNSLLSVATPTKEIIINEKEHYFYFGDLKDGLRHGRGRTQTVKGFAAYDGEYRNDKRDGFGAYYYSTGKICYVGDWKNNKRDGVGVSFRAEDGSMYVGCWEEDEPIGVGAIYDRQGNLNYAGRIENGKREGAGVVYNSKNEMFFIEKWKNNVPTGEGSVFDRDGNLIYIGGWKNGKRHGFGTEYSTKGAVLFVGMWENDVRVEGVIYQNGIPENYGNKKENGKI